MPRTRTLTVRLPTDKYIEIIQVCDEKDCTVNEYLLKKIYSRKTETAQKALKEAQAEIKKLKTSKTAAKPDTKTAAALKAAQAEIKQLKAAKPKEVVKADPKTAAALKSAQEEIKKLKAAKPEEVVKEIVKADPKTAAALKAAQAEIKTVQKELSKAKSERSELAKRIRDANKWIVENDITVGGGLFKAGKHPQF